MFYGFRARPEGPEIPPLAGLGVLVAGIKPVSPISEFADHGLDDSGFLR